MTSRMRVQDSGVGAHDDAVAEGSLWMTEPEPEVERYELRAEPKYHFELERRDFVKLLGAGVLVCFVESQAEAQQRRGGGGGQQPEIGAYVHIGEDGAITVYTGKTEVGQNIRTSLSQAVAEELRVPVDALKLVMADTELCPNDGGTAGSRTTPDTSPRLRRVAAAAREMLVDLAAERTKADRRSLTVADGKVTSPTSNESFSFGELTKGQKLTETVSGEATTTPADRWQVMGTSVPKVAGAAIVTGKHQYTSDIRREGMLHGKVLRAPTLSGKLVSADTSMAEAMPGVTVVRDGEFVGVTAPNSYLAQQALDAIQAEWSADEGPSVRTLYDDLKSNAQQGQRGGRGGFGSRGTDAAQGSIERGLAAADHKLEATYTIAYIAHAPLEPRAAVAEWNNGKLTVWTGTQQPLRVRSNLAETFGLPESGVRVIVPDTGSGYGGKHTNDAAIEAARLAKSAGKPVKLVWTREEEFTWAYFRPAGVIEVSAGVTNDGKLTAWEFHNYNSGGSSIRPLYEVPNVKTQFHGTSAPLKQGSYRALAATANTFARESHIDDLAKAAGMEPLEFRLKNLKDERLRAVLEAAAERFGWEKGVTGDGIGIGIAGGSEKGSYVATCAEVSVDPDTGKVKVERLVTAFECGAIVNPKHLENQVEGCVVQGLGGAIFEEIRYDKGKITTAKFARYRVPRMIDMPTSIETVLLDRKDLPSVGGGETPIIAVAPAIGNAIFRAAGVRLRSLPMAPRGIDV